MAADFNAGSIQGTLDLDTRPFVAGLRKAQAEADNFERKKVTAKADLNTRDLTAKDDEAKAKLDALGSKKVTAKADLNIDEALAKAAILNRALDAGGLGKQSTGLLGGVGRIAMMGSALLSVAAAAGPATAAVVGFGAAAGLAFAGAGISLGLFAKVVTSDMAKIQKAIKGGIQLKGPAGAAETALKSLTKEWTAFQKAAGGPGFKVLTTVFTGLTGILPKLVPLLRTTGNGVNDVLKQVFALSKTPLFDHFLKSLQGFMKGFLQGAGPVLTNLLKSFMNGFIVLQPLMAMLGKGIQQLAAGLAHFTAGGGLKTFLGTVEAAAPKVIALVTALLHGLLNLGKGLAPLAGPALSFITGLVKAIGSLNLAPLASGLGHFLSALQPILPVAANLINVVLKPLGALLSGLAAGPLHQITHALSSELQPAFHALSGILGALVKPLTQFIGSIANLVNPTGIKLAATLLKSLEGAVKVLAPALGHLAVALESVIDNGINVITPLIPKLTPLLNGLAHAAAFVANGLAKILAVKGVGDTLLAIYGGFKLFKFAKGAIDGVVGAFTTLRDACILTRIQLGILKAQELGAAVWAKAAQGIGLITRAFNLLKESTIATRIGLAALKVQEIAVAVWGKIVAAAEKAWAAVQWVLDAALDANPIGIIVIALAALVAGLIYAYNHSKTFRTIVQTAFRDVAHVAEVVFNWLKSAVVTVVDWIKSHWQLLIGILGGPLGVVVALVITHWNQIRSFISSTVSTILSDVGNFISGVVHFFSSLPGRISGFVGQMLSAGVHFFSGVFNGIKQVGAEIISWCTSLPGKIIGAIGNIGARVASSVKGSISGALSGIGHFVGGLVPHFASGGIVGGSTFAMIGDNAGGREAVVPLDKYELPKRGDIAAMLSAATSSGGNNYKQDETNRLLKALLDKMGSPDDLAKAVGKQSEATMRGMVQIARAT